MITIDFTQAITIFISFVLCLVFGLWVSYTYTKVDLVYSLDHFKQCVYCTYIYFSSKKESLQLCPRCKSYIAVETEEKKPES